jgi:hypothetical protein
MNKRGQKKNLDYEQEKEIRTMIMKGLKNQGYVYEWTKNLNFEQERIRA